MGVRGPKFVAAMCARYCEMKRVGDEQAVASAESRGTFARFVGHVQRYRRIEKLPVQIYEFGVPAFDRTDQTLQPDNSGCTDCLFGLCCKSAFDAMPNFRNALDEVNDKTAIQIDAQRRLLPASAFGLEFRVDFFFRSIARWTPCEIVQHGVERRTLTSVAIRHDDYLCPAHGYLGGQFDLVIFAD